MRLTITSNVGLVRQGLEDLSADVPKIGRRRIYNTMLRIRSELRKPGEPVTYPIKWDSDLQRIAFFASDGFGKGIPTRRTGTYVAKYRIVRADNGYAIENTTRYGKYVGGSAYGTGQSRIHAGRWKLMRDVVDAQVAELPQEIVDEIEMVARRLPK